MSGQIDRAVTAADNGEEQDIGFVDNAGSNSRFRFTGDQDLDNGMKLGFIYEIAINTNSSGSFDINNGGGNGGNNLDNRLAETYLVGDWGKFTFGKLDGAADGTSEVNYSGNGGLGGGIDIEDYAGNITFLDDGGESLAKVNDAFNEMDGLSRQNGVRYDTPNLGGFVLSAGLDNGHAYELAGRYEFKADSGMKFGAAADYVDSQSQGRDINPNGVVVNDGGRFQEYGGSAGVLLPSGLNFSGSYKHREYVDAGAGPDADNMYGSVGWIIGQNHVEFSYGQTNDLLNEGSRFRTYGLSYVYNWNSSLELYSSYHHYTLDDAQHLSDNGNPVGDKVDAQDINGLYAGFRLKFL